MFILLFRLDKIIRRWKIKCLKKEGYKLTQNSEEANLILINTCSIREKAEETIAEQFSVLVDVIHWLDSNKFSNTEIRSKVDVILNHSKHLYRGKK